MSACSCTPAIMPDWRDSVVQIDVGTDFPFPRTDSSYGFGDGYAEGG
ncbi:hypothetical protein SAMN05444370_1611, partial [Rubrimonas cliftonensis]